MNPWLEDPAGWEDVHFRLVAGLSDALSSALPERYVVRVEARVYATSDDDEERTIRPDAVIVGPSPTGAPPASGPSLAAATAPVVVPTVMPKEHREHYLHVLTGESGDLVTVIEVLSPTNKRSAGRSAYLGKRAEVLASAAPLVEIDLLREGLRVPMAGPLPEASYYAIVSDRERRPNCEVYAIGLRDRLPAIGVPLRDGERVVVDLQQVLSEAYAKARYGPTLNYDRDPVPPLSPADAAWARERVATARPGSA